MLGKTLEVLVEEEKNGYFEGYSREYIRVKVKKAHLNEIIKVKAIDIDCDTMIAEV